MRDRHPACAARCVSAATPFQNRPVRRWKNAIDSGSISVIADPKSQQTIVLDHIKQQAQILPAAPEPPQPPGIGLAAAAIAPLPTPPVHMQDLGRALIDGHEVEGKRYVVPMPALAAAPIPPGMPQSPQPTVVSEVWTSTKLKMPVLTKTTGSFGQQTCQCKCAPFQDPRSSFFQVPAGYELG
jgi:hypothetical protein